MPDKQDPQHVLSSIASGFNKALNSSGSDEEACPHCGKKPSDEPSKPVGETLGQKIGYPGS